MPVPRSCISQIVRDEEDRGTIQRVQWLALQVYHQTPSSTAMLILIEWSNTRYEVLCSLAILLEITANSYVQRVPFTLYERGQARRQRRLRRQATEKPHRQRRKCMDAYTQAGRQAQAEKDVVGARGAIEREKTVPWRQWGRR
jgi:hypothetical protein